MNKMKRNLYMLSLLMVLLSSCASANQPLSDVTVAPSAISPNADGKDDLARISYRVNARSKVTIYLTDAAGQRYTLRNAEERTPGPTFEYLFNGIAEGHMLPNGDYTWHIDAGDQQTSGALTITDADAVFPKISEMTMSTNVFTPNRDAIDDRIYMSVFTTKLGKLRVYALGGDGVRYEVLPKQSEKRIDENGLFEPGRWEFDFDGGIDLGADPPVDGDYVMTAELEDAIGQRDVVTKPFTIQDSGRPAAEIVIQPNGSGVAWEGIYLTPKVTLPLSGTLHFTMTVQNVGAVPIRTAGPFNPDDCYKMDENRYTKGFVEEPGVWRVGVDFETNTGSDHPWRWAVGTLQDLDVVMHNGDKLYYLAPGKKAVVRGCVQFTRIPPRNPFVIWGALIQEQVEIAPINSRVTPIQVELVKP
jgi:hypothetical protein